MAEFTPSNIWKLARMWGIVLLANFAGTLFAALFYAFAPALTPELKSGMLEISRQISMLCWFTPGTAAIQWRMPPSIPPSVAHAAPNKSDMKVQNDR